MDAERFTDPVFLTLLVAWIMTVVLHEFAHGLVASWGGDYTIKARGGLSLNPLKYVDPINSLALPALFLALGGVPLPGGATYVRRDLIRSKLWNTAVSLAGPMANVMVFLLCAAALHPRVGWIDPADGIDQWTERQVFVAALLLLQGVSVLLNLIPVPPLDGYQAISPYLRPDLRHTLETSPLRTYLFLGYFAALWLVPGFMQALYDGVFAVLGALRFDEASADNIARAYNRVLFPG